jgi:hypothetical protein
VSRAAHKTKSTATARVIHCSRLWEAGLDASGAGLGALATGLTRTQICNAAQDLTRPSPVPLFCPPVVGRLSVARNEQPAESFATNDGITPGHVLRLTRTRNTCGAQL